MKKNFGAKPFICPQLVFIIAAYGENGTPSAVNAARGGISEAYKISICINKGHKTTANILKRRTFAVSMAEVGRVVGCDYVGIVSGNKVSDKFARASFHATRSEFVDAPLVDELSVMLECILKDYNPETCILHGEIVNVSVDERVLDENGKVDVSKVSPIVLDPFDNDYLEVDKRVGNTFSDGKRSKQEVVLYMKEIGLQLTVIFRQQPTCNLYRIIMILTITRLLLVGRCIFVTGYGQGRGLGVTVDKNDVVEAGSIATKDIKSNTIAVGSPATVTWRIQIS